MTSLTIFTAEPLSINKLENKGWVIKECNQKSWAALVKQGQGHQFGEQLTKL